MVTPLGFDRQSSWNKLLTGESAAVRLDDNLLPGVSPLEESMRFRAMGAPVDHDRVRTMVIDRLNNDASLAKRLRDYRTHFAHDCLNNLLSLSLFDALDDADLAPPAFSSKLDGRVGCVIGTSKSSLRAMETEVAVARGSGETSVPVTDRWLNALMPDAPLRTLRWLTQSSGPSSCPVAACATGLVSVIEAIQLIESGQCDICIAGSADAALRPSVLASFHRLGVLSNDDSAAHACKPFDLNRDGFVIGEGAAVVVMESRRHAERRNAPTYGTVTAGALFSDPTGMTQIDTSGEVVANLIDHLTSRAGRPHHIQLHATATEPNDLAEGNGLRTAFGENVPPCSASKGATGHLLGAAGSVELGFAALSLRDGVIPPSVNHETVDPACGVSLSRHRENESQLRSVMKLSLGFGGHIAGCVISR